MVFPWPIEDEDREKYFRDNLYLYSSYLKGRDKSDIETIKERGYYPSFNAFTLKYELPTKKIFFISFKKESKNKTINGVPIENIPLSNLIAFGIPSLPGLEEYIFYTIDEIKSLLSGLPFDKTSKMRSDRIKIFSEYELNSLINLIDVLQIPKLYENIIAYRTKALYIKMFDLFERNIIYVDELRKGMEILLLKSKAIDEKIKREGEKNINVEFKNLIQELTKEHLPVLKINVGEKNFVGYLLNDKIKVFDKILYIKDILLKYLYLMGYD